MRILWIDPIGTDAYREGTLSVIEKAKRSETKVDFISLPPERPLHLEYHSYEALVVGDIVRLVFSNAKNYDAFIIGCFYDVALREAREVSQKAVVTAPCESASILASQIGNRFSVLIGRRKWASRIEDNLRLYGQNHKLASIRDIEMTVSDFSKNDDQVTERLISEGRKAVREDAAEVIIVGCTADCHSYEIVQQELGVPVIDAISAPLKNSEMLADAARRLAWYPSRVHGSEPPPIDEANRWIVLENKITQ